MAAERDDLGGAMTKGQGAQEFWGEWEDSVKPSPYGVSQHAKNIAINFAEAYAASLAKSPRELIEKAADILTNACQIIDVTKTEWGEAWSDWDQSVRDAASNWLKAYHGPADSTSPTAPTENSMKEGQGAPTAELTPTQKARAWLDKHVAIEVHDDVPRWMAMYAGAREKELREALRKLRLAGERMAIAAKRMEENSSGGWGERAEVDAAFIGWRDEISDAMKLLAGEPETKE